MPGCFVPNCRSGTKKTKNSIRNSLFRPPKDPKLFETWSRKIPRKDRSLTSNDRVCELHFDPVDIIRSYETRLPNGEIWRIPRDRISLQSDAIPTVFPNCPSYLSSLPKQKKRKAPKNRENLPTKKARTKKSCENSLNASENIMNSIKDEVSPNNEERVETKCYNTIASNLLCEFRNVEISKPQIQFDISRAIHANLLLPPSWTYTVLENAVAFLRWSDDLKFISHRLVVHNDGKETLTFVGDTQIIINGYKEFSSLEKVIEALQKITNLKVCSSKVVQDKNNRKSFCRGFVQEGDTSTFCVFCKNDTNTYQGNHTQISRTKNISRMP